MLNQLVRVSLILTFVLSAPGHATVVEIDLFSASDGLVTRDTDSGLDWLDLTETTSVSYYEIQAGAGGWVDSGWRHATGAEVCGLSAALGLPIPSCPAATANDLEGVGNGVSGSFVEAHQHFLGLTSVNSTLDGTVLASIGFYDDGGGADPNLAGIANFQYGFGDNSLARVLDDHNAGELNVGQPHIGNYLVRSIPEPSIVGLLSLFVLVAGLRVSLNWREASAESTSRPLEGVLQTK